MYLIINSETLTILFHMSKTLKMVFEISKLFVYKNIFKIMFTLEYINGNNK